MLSIKEIKTKYEHKDVNGNVADTFIKIPRYFEDIEFIYSDSLEKGKVKFSTTMQKLYCYLLGWQESGLTCYEAHEELSNVCRLSRSKTTELILLMERVGLIKVVKIEGRRNKELIALPITDSHLNPPESIHASPVEDVKPISNAIPQVVIEEPAQCDTEALSDDVKECPFFTTSEEAFNNESEPSQESSDYNYMEDEEEINTISIKDKDYLIARANQFYANHAVGDSENTLSSLLISEMNIESVHLDFVIAHFRQEKRAFTERFKQENKCQENHSANNKFMNI